MAEPPLPPIASSDALTRSELLPLGSTRINILRSRALVPFVLTGATCVGLFYAIMHIPGYKISVYMNILATFIVFMMFLGLYLYSGERKNILWYGFPAVLVALQLEFTFRYYYFVTRQWLPGDTKTAQDTFPGQFVANVFGPGFSEEFLKAGALFIGLALATWLRRSHSRGNVLTRGLALEGPIDGMLMGAASGGAFILIETMAQYVPNAMRAATTPAAGAAQGLMLLIPRVLNGVVGHMAYAGIFGYFAGLAVSHPRATFRLLGLGFVLAALLHGFWNSSSFLSPTSGLGMSAFLTGTIYFACFMKARQLEASRLGLPVDGRSILALTPHLAVGPPRAAGIVPPTPTGVAGALSGVATAFERSIGVTARTTTPPPGGFPGSPGIPPSGLSIDGGDARYALEAGRPLDFTTLFASAGVPPGCIGAVVAAPEGGLQIRNTGSATWAVLRQDGSAATIAPGGTVRPLDGMKLVLGHATIGIHAY